MNTRLIQVDCNAVIRKALDEARMSYVGFVETDKHNYLCVFSSADLDATERMAIFKNKPQLAWSYVKYAQKR